jgi:hypothetical protein
MAEPASARGEIELADDDRAGKRGNPRQRRDPDNNETIDKETRLLIRGSSRGHAAEETTPTRDRVRL